MKQALEILRAIPEKIKDISGNPSDVTAYFSDYTDSALVVTFYYYIEKQGDVLKTTSDVNLEILDSFAKAGLTFAFPTRTLLVLGRRGKSRRRTGSRKTVRKFRTPKKHPMTTQKNHPAAGQPDSFDRYPGLCGSDLELTYTPQRSVFTLSGRPRPTRSG